MKFTLAIFIYLICTVTTNLVTAAEQKYSFEEYVSGLDLTSEQLERVASVLQSSAKKRDKTLKSYGINMSNDRKARLSFREKLVLQDEMKKVADNLSSDMEDILEEEQFSLWKAAHEQHQQMFKEKLMQKLN